jgi:hypothetical protein
MNALKLKLRNSQWYQGRKVWCDLSYETYFLTILAGLYHCKFYMSIASSDLVTLAAHYITLRESRRNFRGNCPFHQDTTGSFMISPEKNIFKCFGCGKEGGPAEFISGMAELGLAS